MTGQHELCEATPVRIRYKTRANIVRRSPWAAGQVAAGLWDAYLSWSRSGVDLPPVKPSFLRGFGR